jgi:hypothetical protein
MLAALGAALWMISHTSSAACLRREITISNGSKANSFVLVPEREVEEFTSQGFARIECSSDPAVLRQYVQRICEGPLRSVGPSFSDQANFERVRTRACASARAALTEATEKKTG